MAIRLLVALGAIAALLAPAASPAAPRVETYWYEVGLGDITALCESNRGGVCLFPEGGDATIAVQVTDDLSDRVGVEIGFYDADGDRIGDYVTGCDAIGPVTIPPNALEVDVFIDGPVLGLVDCGGVAAGTSGTITVAWA